MTTMLSRCALALAVCAVTGVAHAQSGVQSASRAQLSDPRWAAWIGCWTPVDAGAVAISLSGSSAPSSYVCVSPAAAVPGVDIASIVNGRIVARDRVDATGARNVKTVDGCTGWESAKWSSDGRRLFTRSEFTCPGNLTRRESGVFALTAYNEWLDVQGIDVMGSTSARATRFYEALVEVVPTDKPDSVVMRPVDSPERYAVRTARMAAAAPVSSEQVLNLVQNVDVQVAEAFLTEVRPRFDVDAKTLVRLSDAGLPPRMLDLMVALSYPKTFRVGKADTEVERTPRAVGGSAFGGNNLYGGRWSDSFNGGLSDCSRFGNRFSGYGNYYSLGFADSCFGNSMYGRGLYGSNQYGFGNNYFGAQPIIIVRPSGEGSASSSRGRAISGRGYTREPRDMADPSRGPGPSGASSTQSTSGSSGSGGASSGESGTGGRTAKPRGSGQ